MKKMFYKNDTYYVDVEEVTEDGFVEFYVDKITPRELDCGDCEIVEVEVVDEFYVFQVFCLKILEDEETFTLYKCSEWDDKQVFTRGREDQGA